DVTVSGAEGSPTGEVVVSAGGVELSRGTVTDGTGTVELPADLAVGTYALSVSYAGGGAHKPSSGTARLTVVKAATTVTATPSANPVKPSVAAKLTIQAETVTGLAGSGKITVQVKRGISTVATLTGTLDADGTVVVTLPKFAAATYS